MTRRKTGLVGQRPRTVSPKGGPPTTPPTPPTSKPKQHVIKMYRNHPGDSDGSKGYIWFRSENAALVDAGLHPCSYVWEGAQVAKGFTVPRKVKELEEFLNMVASYPDGT